MSSEAKAPIALETAAAAAGAAETRPLSERVIRILGKYGTLIVLGLMVVGFSIYEGEYFLTTENFSNILIQSTISVLIALGLTFVLVAGEFDLSFGYTASLAGMIIAGEFFGGPLRMTLVVVIVLAACMLIGVLNGILVTKVGIVALVATLGVGSLVLGVDYLYSGGFPRTLLQDGAGLTDLYLGSFLGIRYPLWMLAIVSAACWLLLNRTSFGLEMQAVGSNPVAAALSGIKVARIKTIAFALCAGMAAFGGVMITANSGSGSLVAGDYYMLSSFAAAFLGSAALRNGEFHVLGTLIGVITVAVGFNGLALMGVQASAQFLFQGALLIAAVGMSTAARRFGERGA